MLTKIVNTINTKIIRRKKILVPAVILLILLLSSAAYALINKQLTPNNPATESQTTITSLHIESQPTGVKIIASCSAEENVTPFDCKSSSSINAELNAPVDHIGDDGKKFQFKEWQGCESVNANVCNKSLQENQEAKIIAIYEPAQIEAQVPSSKPSARTPSGPKYCTNPEKDLGSHFCKLNIAEIPKLVKVNIVLRGKAPSYPVKWFEVGSTYKCVRDDGLVEPSCTLESPKNQTWPLTEDQVAEILVHSKGMMTLEARDYLHSQDCGVRTLSPCFSFEQYRFSGFDVTANNGANYQVTYLYDFHCYIQEPTAPSAQYPYEQHRC